MVLMAKMQSALYASDGQLIGARVLIVANNVHIGRQGLR
jgi:hypothetical protein